MNYERRSLITGEADGTGTYTRVAEDLLVQICQCDWFQLQARQWDFV